MAVVLVCGAAGAAIAYFAFAKPDGAGKATEQAATGQADTASGEGAGTEGTDAQSGASSNGGADAGGGTSSSPEGALRRHFELIDQGDYEAAWRIFHPAYRNGAGARWVDTKNKERPRIDIKSLKATQAGQLGLQMVRVDVELVAADTAGGAAGVCRHFVGWARLQQVNGEWLYRPEEGAGGKSGLQTKAISDSDPRCRRVLE